MVESPSLEVWAWSLGTWFGGGLGSMMFGLEDLMCLFQLKWSYGSVISFLTTCSWFQAVVVFVLFNRTENKCKFDGNL